MNKFCFARFSFGTEHNREEYIEKYELGKLKVRVMARGTHARPGIHTEKRRYTAFRSIDQWLAIIVSSLEFVEGCTYYAPTPFFSLPPFS